MKAGHRVGLKKILIANTPLLCSALRAALKDEPRFEIDEVHSFLPVLDTVGKSNPDLIILNMFLGGVSAMDTLSNLKTVHPQLFVLVTGESENTWALRATRKGAVGFISLDTAVEHIRPAVETAFRGELVVSDGILKTALNGLARGEKVGDPFSQLSDRELEVFSAIGDGKGTRAIAEMLHVSIKTIESHRAHIKEKLHLKDAAQLTHNATLWCQK